MITDTLTRIFTSRPVKILLGLAVMLAVTSQLIPMIVDTKPYVEKLATRVRETSGGTLMIKGGSEIQIMPRVALVVRAAEISQPHVAHSPSVTADVAEIGVDIWSLFSGAPYVNSVRMAGVAVSAEKQDGAAAQWGFLGLPLLKTLAAAKSEHNIHVEIYNGHASVGNVKTGETTGLTNIQLIGDFGTAAQLSGSLNYGELPIRFSVQRSGAIGATPVELLVDAGEGNHLSLKGQMDFTADNPVITAKLQVALADAMVLLSGKPEVADKSAMPAGDPLPFTLAADYTQKQGLISLNNIVLDLMGSKGAGSLEWNTLQDAAHKLALHFSVLELSGAKKLFGFYKAQALDATADREPRTLVNKKLGMALDITADRIQNGTQSWSSAAFNGTIANGSLTVNKLSLTMPGESSTTLFGLVSVSDTQGLRFEGNVEMQGSSLREALTVFDDSAANLPALGFGAYSLKSNVFVSSELLRLSEADAKFSELSLKGGLVAYLDKKPRIEAEVGLRDINFDYFRDSWRSNAGKDTNEEPVFFRFDRSMNFDWLKKLYASIDFKVDVQGFTFLERKGKSANFRLFAQANELGVYNAKFNYEQDTTEANLKLDVTGEQPRLNLVLNTKEMNTAYFALDPTPPEPVAPPPKPVAAAKPAQQLPDMLLPAATPEEEMRAKIAEEAASMPDAAQALPTDAAATPAGNVPVVDVGSASQPAPAPFETSATPVELAPLPTGLPATPASNVPVIDAEKPAASEPVPLLPQTTQAATPSATDEDAGEFEDATPLAEDANTKTTVTTTPQSLLVSAAEAQEAAPVAPAPAPAEGLAPVPGDTSAPGSARWSETPIDMSFMEGINGSFDISVGKLQHKNLLFQNFKMLAKLERNLLTFQTLTFAHWGGSFSINGTVFGGKVPGISLGFIIASADIQDVLVSLLNIHTIAGRASISGTIDTSGVNLLSWVSQASAKMLVAGRGVTISGFDVAAVVPAVLASRTAADVLNNVNLSLVSGSGEYSADGAINLQKGIVSTPGIALKTGRVVGSVVGDFRLIQWDVNLSGVFKFPELSAGNVPTMTARWSGPVEGPALQTDTQSLEAFASKRIIGN